MCFQVLKVSLEDFLGFAVCILLIHMLVLMFIILQFLTHFFSILSTYYYNLGLDVSSQSCDLEAEIYGGHQSSHKHIKTFFLKETWSLRYCCWTYVWSLHLCYLALVYLGNNAAICERGTAYVLASTLSFQSWFPSSWPSCLRGWKMLSAVFIRELSIQSAQNTGFFHLLHLLDKKRPLFPPTSDILTILRLKTS